MEAEAGQKERNRENSAVLTGHTQDTHEGISDAPQVSRNDPDDVMSILVSRQERRNLFDSPEQESRVSRRETYRSPRSDVQDDNFGKEKDRFSKYNDSKPVENKDNTVGKLTEILKSDATPTDNTDVGLCLDLR